MRLKHLGLVLVVTLACAVTGLTAQTGVAPPAAAPAKGNAIAQTAAAPLPPSYVIGAADILSVLFWRDKELSADVVTVRPDGMISLPLINELKAAGLTPDQLRLKVLEAAGKFVTDPDVAVVVREIKSRNVYITGSVAKPGTYQLNNDLNVLQLIAVGGGLLEYADAKNISVIRMEGGLQHSFPFNYRDVIKRKHTAQNIALKPGDTVVVP